MVLWLRLCPPTTGGRVQLLVKDPTCFMGMAKILFFKIERQQNERIVKSKAFHFKGGNTQIIKSKETPSSIK